MTLVEIGIVVVLSAMVLLGATVLSNRTTVHFRKGSELLDTQVLLESIVERLRSDVRSLAAVRECSGQRFVMATVQDGIPAEVAWEYDAARLCLLRRDASGAADLHSTGKIDGVLFVAQPATGDFRYLKLYLQLHAQELGSKTPSRLSLVGEFHSRCLRPRNPFGGALP